MTCADGVADAGKEISYWIGEVHSSPSSPVRSRLNDRENLRRWLWSPRRRAYDSVCNDSCSSLCRNYQLDLTTPGISPLRASPRKQRRHTPNFRRNALGRPQSWQRLCWRDLNFGLRASLTRFAVVAIVCTLYSTCKLVQSPRREPDKYAYAPTRNGMPNALSNARAPLSSLAVVTMVTFIPFSLSTLA